MSIAVEPISTASSAVSPDSSSRELLSNLFLSLIIASLTLGLVGAYGRYERHSIGSPSKSALGAGGDGSKASRIEIGLFTGLQIARRVMSIALPFIAALQLGCPTASILLVIAIASGIVSRDTERFDKSGRWLLSQRIWTLAFSCLLCLAAAFNGSSSGLSSLIGVLAVITFSFFCHPPYPVEASAGGPFASPPPSSERTSAMPSGSWEAADSAFALPRTKMYSPLIASIEDTWLTLVSGAFALAAAFVLYHFGGFSIINAEFGMVLVVVSLLATWSSLGLELAVFGSSPIPLATGLATAIIGNALLFSSFSTLWQSAIVGAIAYMAVRLDVAKSRTGSLASVQSSQSDKHGRHATATLSAPTKIMLQFTEPYPLLHGIIADKDSRRIFYFMLLNLCFMLVQSAYGFLTGSLGLISDSIHMFFDCIALLVGLCAAVMSKWPPSVKYPYGYGKLDTLAGFGNGIFLMLISIEIVWEAIERLVEGADVSRTMELLIVSSLGLLVNLVGIMAFDHGHAHGHGGHSHGEHSHSHEGHNHGQSGHHHHHHGGDNMYGIYLHIMADALGSVAVVVSTLCVRYFGWSGFDPLASCAIAILIFASAVPLVLSSGQKLLLSLPGDVEYTLRDILAGVSTIRGVVGYTVPKFWLDDIGKTDTEHEHHHDNDHHKHDHTHDHTHDHVHNHEQHSHGHNHAHSHHQHQNSNHSHHSHHSHHGECENEGQMILGMMHVIASQHADINDVRSRVLDYLRSKNMDIIVQVERDGEAKCWCGGIQK